MAGNQSVRTVIYHEDTKTLNQKTNHIGIALRVRVSGVNSPGTGAAGKEQIQFAVLVVEQAVSVGGLFQHLSRHRN